MKHNIEINKTDNGCVYIRIYEVICHTTEGNERVYQRYLTEEQAEETCKMLHNFEDEEYQTAFWVSQLVFL